MGLIRSVPDDEIAAELASAWSDVDDDGPPAVVGAGKGAGAAVGSTVGAVADGVVADRPRPVVIPDGWHGDGWHGDGWHGDIDADEDAGAGAGADWDAGWDGDPDHEPPRGGDGSGRPGSDRPARGPVRRRRPGDPRSVTEAAERVRPVSLAGEQVLPVLPALEELLPGGLPRGATVAIGGARPAGGVGGAGVRGAGVRGAGVRGARGAGVGGPGARGADVRRARGAGFRDATGEQGTGAAGWSGATSLALALAAAPSAAGSWVVAVGLPGLGLAAVAEAGIALHRFAVVATPPAEVWATVVASLVGAFDVVLLGPPPVVRLADERRLAARARERGAVLVRLDSAAARGTAGGSRPAPPVEADLRLQAVATRWEGLGDGHGHLRTRRLEVEVSGRRQASRLRRVELRFDAAGALTIEPGASLVPAPPTRAAAPLAFAGSDIDDLTAVDHGGAVDPVAASGAATASAPDLVVGTIHVEVDGGRPAPDLDEVRRERIRRLARRPLAPPSVDPEDVRSDAG